MIRTWATLALGLATIFASFCSLKSIRSVKEAERDSRLQMYEKTRNESSTLQSTLLLAHPNVTDRHGLIYNATEMHMFVEDGFKKQFCPKILAMNQKIGNVLTQNRLIQISFSCQEVFLTNGYGTGNFLMSIYTLRSVAEAIGGVDIELSCYDAYYQRDKLILPWLMGWFPRHTNESLLQINNNLPVKRKCRQLDKEMGLPLGRRIKDIQHDLRRMAISLVGIPSREHASYEYAKKELWERHTNESKIDRTIYALSTVSENQTALLPNFELDEVTIHFRCGDLIDSTEPRYGFMRFDSYANQISVMVESIGIVTESFEASGQVRQAESKQHTRDRCRLVVTAFAEHLQARFPSARIKIRNGVNETIASSYARMLMSDQIIISLSTFAFFPAVATFGTAHVRRPSRKNLGAWIVQAAEEGIVDGVVFFDEPDWLTTTRCKQLWGDDGSAVLDWFRNKTSDKSSVRR